MFYLGASVVAIVCNIGPAGVLLAQWRCPCLWPTRYGELLLIASQCMLQPGRYVHVEWSMHFGSYGHGMDNVTPICAKQRFRIPYEMKTNPEMKAYRGGCTDKNWSNTTTCPDWCNDSKHDVHLAILTCRLITLFPLKRVLKLTAFPTQHPPILLQMSSVAHIDYRFTVTKACRQDVRAVT